MPIGRGILKDIQIIHASMAADYDVISFILENGEVFEKRGNLVDETDYFGQINPQYKLLIGKKVEILWHLSTFEYSTFDLEMQPRLHSERYKALLSIKEVPNG